MTIWNLQNTFILMLFLGHSLCFSPLLNLLEWVGFYLGISLGISLIYSACTIIDRACTAIKTGQRGPGDPPRMCGMKKSLLIMTLIVTAVCRVSDSNSPFQHHLLTDRNIYL